jgi:thiaminase/transcriptional activator TenA
MPDWGTSGRAPAGAIAVERSLHEGFFARFGLSEEDVARTPMAPTNLAYTSYLIATAYGGSFPELLGAVLPCYWIYWEVGKALLERGRRTPSMGAGSRPTAVRSSPRDRLGPELSPAERASAGRHFASTSRYEWMFLGHGYRSERWPISAEPPRPAKR